MENYYHYIRLLRINHWYKNLVVFLGVFFSIQLLLQQATVRYFALAIISFFLASLVSSVNYIINELVDAQGDKNHPVKKNRAIPSGKISITAAHIIWKLLLIFTVVSSYFILDGFSTLGIIALFCAGILYNIPPFRFKEIPYLDVVSESVNNPIRFLIGWYVTSPDSHPSLLLLCGLWTSGALLMTLKRLLELKELTIETAVKYRSSFRHYSLPILTIYSTFWLVLTLVLFIMYVNQ